MNQVKVIIRNGIISDVLADGQVDVEIVDIDSGYEDYHALCKYEDELYSRNDLKPIDFKVAHFNEETAE